MDSKQILETLQVQPLSEEEKAKRHILCRLYGPIATFKEETRNGRMYGKELWEKALSDEIFLEKLATKDLVLEFDHPHDGRQEIDHLKGCAIIPEAPKIIGNDLYAYVDVLDLPNGKILKTYLDYGWVPGISSRGSGDVLQDGNVDPDTFILETWDIVGLPAVKSARLQCCESVDPKTIKLRKALTEAYNAASDKDKEIMKETLENQNITLEAIDEVPEYDIDAEDAENKTLQEAEVEVEAEDVVADETAPVEDEIEVADEVVDEEPETVEVEAEETEETESEEKADEEEVESVVSNWIDTLKDAEKDASVEFAPITVGDKEITVTGIEFDVVKDDDENKLTVKIDYEPVEADNIEAEESEVKIDEISVNGEEESEGEEIAPEEVIDDEADEVMESLKEAIRAKDELEEANKKLFKEKTVSDAEVATLKEELNRYKLSFERTSELAAKSKDLEKEIAKLQEALSSKDTRINELEAQTDNTVKLNESMNENARKVKTLTENISALQKDLATAESTNQEQKAQYEAKLTESVEVARKYKAKFNLMLNHYVEYRASMLGVKSTDITGRLGESFKPADIDKVCDDLLETSFSINRLPNSIVRVNRRDAVNESVVSKKADPDDGYAPDPFLYDLLK